MKTIVYQGPNDVAVEEVDEPEIEHPNDAILDVTTSAICESDLHMYEGRTAIKPGTVFGHENMGIVSEIGNEVNTLEEGDRVVAPFNIACGFCENCENEYTGFCTNVNPGFAGAIYRDAAMGPYKGGMGEKVRIPYADVNALQLPDGDEHEEAFMLLADLFPTGWHGTRLANLQPGESIAVFGAGQVGLMSAYSAKLQGASEIYVVDRVPSRLELAEKHCNAQAVNFEEGDPVEQIITEHGGEVDKGIDAVGYQSLDPKGVEKNNEVPSKRTISNRISHYSELYTKSIFNRESLSDNEIKQLTKLERAFNQGEVKEKHIERFATDVANAYADKFNKSAVGPLSEEQHHSVKSMTKRSFIEQTRKLDVKDGRNDNLYNPAKDNPAVVINNLIRVVRPTGKLGIIGLYVPSDPGAPDEMAAQGRLGIDFGRLFEKGQALGTGQCNVKAYNRQLRDMIIEGRADPSWVVSHRGSIEEAPEMYEKASKNPETVIKVVLTP
jgi:threonine dehydrogenase-like Zn-dependent dehydrogenase